MTHEELSAPTQVRLKKDHGDEKAGAVITATAYIAGKLKAKGIAEALPAEVAPAEPAEEPASPATSGRRK